VTNDEKNIHKNNSENKYVAQFKEIIIILLEKI